MLHEDAQVSVSERPNSAADEWSLVQSVLSLAVEDKTVLETLPASAFYDQQLGEVWRNAQAVYQAGKSVTPRAVRVHAQAGEMHPVSRMLDRLAAHPVQQRPLLESARTVEDLAKLRNLLDTLSAVSEHAETAADYGQALQAVHAALSEMEGDTTPRDVVSWDDAVEEWKHVQDDDTSVRVFPTPWQSLNDVIAGGLHSGRTYITGARPGVGKSIMGANLAQFAAENGHRAVIFSAEMGTTEVTSRLIASGARANYGQITRQSIDRTNYDRITSYVERTRGLPLHIVDKPDLTLNYIRSTCRTMKRSGGLDVVFVDYLQLMRPEDTRISREQQVAQISRGLKILSRDLDCAVVIACQLNRESKSENRAPRLNDLRESGSIEQDADVVILLDRDDSAEGERAGEVDLVIAKNRTGATCTRTLGFAGHQAAFREMPGHGM